MSLSELGQFSSGFVSWRRILASTPEAERLALFHNACQEVADYVRRGLDPVLAADELHDMTMAAGSMDTDAVQHEISEAFRHIRRPDMVPDDIGEPYRNGKHKSNGGAQAPELQPLPSFDVGDFEGRSLPVRRWCVHDRIPMRNVTLLSGDGATGKTTIALQLAVLVATSQNDWLGAMIDEPGPVLFLTAEEELDEIHYRLEMIVQRYGLTFSNTRARMHLICRPGEDCVLGAPNLKTASLLLTEQYARLRLTIDAIKPKLVILESSADLFAGNESDRSLVRQFIRALRSLSIEYDCAIVLISHPSLVGLSSGSGTAGSTQWQNSVRSRMYFTRDKDTKEDDNSDIRLLKVMKLNYAKQGEVVRVKFDKGVFNLEQKLTGFAEQARDQELERTFMVLLERFNKEGRHVSDKEGKTYAPAHFAKETVAKAIKATSSQLTAAMLRLFEARRIQIVWDGPPSRRRSRLIPSPSNVMEREEQMWDQSGREVGALL
jgi:RecA-family ATPase